LGELFLDFIEFDFAGLRIHHHLFVPRPVAQAESARPSAGPGMRQQILHELLFLTHFYKFVTGHFSVVVFFHVAEKSLGFGVQLSPEL
jgi:hypothetical protein